MPVDPELLDPYDHLIPVTVEGRAAEVPANNSVLRILQYLDYDLYPCRLCWNGECDNCVFTYLDADGQEVRARGCETTAVAGMCILRVPENAVHRPAAATSDPP